ncbi:MAG: DUF2283 domain-containing protein [Candidatus Nanoarchaeia archaeon]|nr:DUF2283 domain-containing protein [Candidatus Nanoarchaeia archaeon]
MKFKFDYNPVADSLYVVDEKKEVKSSLRYGNAVIDFDSEDKIAGIELLNVSKNYNYSKSLFKAIKKAKITKKVIQNVLFVLVILVLKEVAIRVPENKCISEISLSTQLPYSAV